MQSPLIVQGHDWHLFIISRDVAHRPRQRVTWPKIDVRNTRSRFDVLKVTAVQHVLLERAATKWRPWFHQLIAQSCTLALAILEESLVSLREAECEAAA